MNIATLNALPASCYMIQRGKVFYYKRRTPQILKKLDSRDFIQLSLKTSNLTLAFTRALKVNEAAETY